jgi:hypothetical protein
VLAALASGVGRLRHLPASLVRWRPVCFAVFTTRHERGCLLLGTSSVSFWFWLSLSRVFLSHVSCIRPVVTGVRVPALPVPSPREVPTGRLSHTHTWHATGGVRREMQRGLLSPPLSSQIASCSYMLTRWIMSRQNSWKSMRPSRCLSYLVNMRSSCFGEGARPKSSMSW